jgi:hypothetical protein
VNNLNRRKNPAFRDGRDRLAPPSVSILRWLLSLAFTAALVACGGGGSAANDGSAVSFAAAAAPAARPGSSCSFDHVFVTVQGVQVVQQAAGGQQTTDIPLASPQRIDLLNLSGGLLQALGAPLLAAGNYSSVQLVLVDGASQVQPTGGSLAPLQVAGSPKGFTIKANLTVAPGQFGDIALQGFDPCQSIVQAGSPTAPRFLLKPQLGFQASVVVGIQRVNTTTDGTQVDASVSRMSDGGYVVVWKDPDFKLPPSALPVQRWCWQRYAAGGTRVGDERCILSGDLVLAPKVAGLADGGFAVTWMSFDTDGFGIWALQYRADGSATDFAHFVNTVQAGHQVQPAIAALSGGGYVITWRSGVDIFARRYNADGVPLGVEQRADTFIESGFGTRNQPAVAGLADGGYVVTWTSQFQDPARNLGIYMQRFAADGTPLGSETLVSLDTFTATDPAVAGLKGGGFVITWLSGLAGGPSVVAQQFTAAGERVGALAVVDPMTLPPTTCPTRTGTAPCPAESQFRPAVAGLDDGGYVIAWQALFRAGGTSGVYARRYAADGTADGPAALVGLMAPPVP